MSFAAIILAAGASRRMGTPKALLAYQGETFVDRLIGIFAPQCEPVIVVLGHHAAAIRLGLHRVDACVFVENPNPERGQLSSLQCGLQAVPDDVRGVLFMPVDYPAVRQVTVEHVIGAFGDAPFIIPRHEGKHGHPVLFQRSIAAEFLSLPPDSTAREVVHRYRALTRYVDVDDPGVVRDVDDPAAYRSLLSAVEPV